MKTGKVQFRTKVKVLVDL